MGAVLREQNALPYGAWIMENLTAKDDVDNVGAGRAAKGAIPSPRPKNAGNCLNFLHFFIFNSCYLLQSFQIGNIYLLQRYPNFPKYEHI